MTLGQVLKSKRLELGKSIEQIATATRIHIKVLRALEDDQYGELPARAFTRGFIISYCKSLHIDPDQILKDYHDFLESKFAERPEKDHGHHGYAFEGKETEQNKRWMIIIASTAAFFAVLTLLFFKPQNHKHKEKHKELIAEEVDLTMPQNPSPLIPSEQANPTATGTSTAINTESSTIISTGTDTAVKVTIKVAESPTPAATPTATPAASPSATPKEDPLNKGDGMLPKNTGVKIVILATEDTLIHYHSDQRKPFSLMLRKDKQLVIKANDLIKIETDTPEHIKYRLSFKNKANSEYSELKEHRLELHKDGTATTFNAGAL